MTTLRKWQAASNYMGEEYPDYYVLLGQHRDSTLLDQSNFRVALAELGGESDTVVVVRSGHWAVGWIETILIHKTDTSALATGNDILARLANYPVLDDDDYSEAEYNAAIRNIKDAGYHYSLTEYQARSIYQWLDNRGDALDNTDDTGYYPDDTTLDQAVRALRY
jgi:hypothetical protein